MSEKRLEKKYPDAKYLIAVGYGHGGLQGEEPERYGRIMKDIVEGRKVNI